MPTQAIPKLELIQQSAVTSRNSAAGRSEASMLVRQSKSTGLRTTRSTTSASVRPSSSKNCRGFAN